MKTQNKQSNELMRDALATREIISYSDFTPIIDISPTKRDLAVVRGSALNATSATLVLGTGRKKYLYGLCLALIKDATSTSTLSRITGTINNATVGLIEIPSLTLTAQTSTISIHFTNPVRLDDNTNLTLTNSTNVANITANATAYYYSSDD
jgi:hypothetical protein